jgi:hypothetical protein
VQILSLQITHHFSMSRLISSTSGTCFAIIPVLSQSTIADAAASYPGLTMASGSGFYELSKSEDVSATKSMLLRLPDSSNVEDDAARSVLQLKGAKAKITPAQVCEKAGEGSQLWVQSTSSNRGMAAGTSVAVKNPIIHGKAAKADGNAPAAAASSSAFAAAVSAPAAPASKPSAKSRARKAEVVEEDEDGEEDADEEEAVPARKKAKVAAAKVGPAAPAAGGLQVSRSVLPPAQWLSSARWT